MSALLFVVVFAAVLGAASLLGITRRTDRDVNGWRPAEEKPVEPDRDLGHRALSHAA